MIREIDIKVVYDVPIMEDRKITQASRVEEMVYDDIIERFADDEGFCGLRVDCKDTYKMDPDKERRLKQFVGDV